MGNFEENDEASRARKLAKRRKTNLILNSLITIVLLLIVFVTVKIFFGDGQSEAEKSDSVVVDKQLANEKADGDSGNEDEEEEVEEEKQDASDLEEESESADEELEEESEPTITEGGSSPDVKQTIVNPDWKPVGTTQTGEHQAVYDESSVDWQEMLKAISYATGIDGGNMTVWFLGNNGGPQSAQGTVSDKAGGPKYRVAIDWVDGEGWKPVKVEELK
ncbi:YrrS family protein [Mesobacillus maritimus]|uniref:YrrS family protein n=1 Tax=Mesobacillus maritimus TaxID=1643336 RepID=A0ABS7K2C1_9BACI|nr:YrrS family protein [Mesobacillus maritimus]MBY0096286.1 YrrS family protein [Mesobacillus maritimus]